jgi:hypothetical protein
MKIKIPWKGVPWKKKILGKIFPWSGVPWKFFFLGAQREKLRKKRH